ncbi:MAG: protein phosphatase 2C domain-containing protein [Treponema sp.]|jgi:serine/threonine protein phosphatase PrpC|nr:protein phosphatase 2C domain-containing protein [Treponema sp.]
MKTIGKYWNKKVLVKFAVKAQGMSHLEKGTPCQDACTAQLSKNLTVGVACVADGHGGNKYFRSDKGSKMAVQVAEKALFDFCGTIAREKKAFFITNSSNKYTKKDDILSKLKQLEGNIIYQWRNAVLDDINANPFTEAEKEFCNSNKISLEEDHEKMMFVYGTTLLAGLVSDSFWYVIQIGDGLCVVLENEESIITPIKEDERLAFGRTTSLCENDAIKNFRESFGFSRIIGLTVATDGIADSFEPGKFLRFNKELYDNFTTIPEKAKTELEAFLPELSERGSRDDVSIAGIFRAIGENKRVLSC